MDVSVSGSVPDGFKKIRGRRRAAIRFLLNAPFFRNAEVLPAAPFRASPLVEDAASSVPDIVLPSNVPEKHVKLKIWNLYRIVFEEKWGKREMMSDDASKTNDDAFTIKGIYLRIYIHILYEFFFYSYFYIFFHIFIFIFIFPSYILNFHW